MLVARRTCDDNISSRVDASRSVTRRLIEKRAHGTSSCGVRRRATPMSRSRARRAVLPFRGGGIPSTGRLRARVLCTRPTRRPRENPRRECTVFHARVVSRLCRRRRDVITAVPVWISDTPLARRRDRRRVSLPGEVFPHRLPSHSKSVPSPVSVRISRRKSAVTFALVLTRET